MNEFLSNKNIKMSELPINMMFVGDEVSYNE